MTHPADEMKECPSCAETIRAKAVRCRFCGHEMVLGAPVLAPTLGPAPMASHNRPGAGLNPVRGVFQGFFGCIGAIIAIFFLIVVIGTWR